MDVIHQLRMYKYHIVHLLDTFTSVEDIRGHRRARMKIKIWTQGFTEQKF